MDHDMFCFQCEQTVGGTACTGCAGACGKSAETANAQDELTGALIGLARAASSNPITENTDRLILEGLFTTVTNVNFHAEEVRRLTQEIRAEKDRIAPGCASCAARCGNTDDYDLQKLWGDDPDIRSLKSLILFGLRGMGAYAYHAMVLGFTDTKVMDYIYKALFVLTEDWDMEALLPVVLECGEANYACMELLDKANTKIFGQPSPTEVSLTVEKGPFIVVSGHDLFDLRCLLEQTKGLGINVYTHSEMLPAHGYPGLRQYPHLKGNFGTAWQNQQKEFENLPGAVLFTTNCLMPVRPSYADRVFTTEAVSYPGLVHIGPERDFSPVIRRALELGGYPEDQHFTGINGGHTVSTGYAHDFILSHAPQVLEAVQSGALRHIFLVGGCDGARPGRNYYTEFVQKAPADTLILTLACGKYRFNDLALGTVGGLPRLMDVGQCNDAYSAIRVAVGLAEALGCGVNDLPLSMILSWYEQKAVAILLTLLYLGIRDIRLGPSLPAFVSPNVLAYLSEHYGLQPISTPEEDLRACLSR